MRRNTCSGQSNVFPLAKCDLTSLSWLPLVTGFVMAHVLRAWHPWHPSLQSLKLSKLIPSPTPHDPQEASLCIACSECGGNLKYHPESRPFQTAGTQRQVARNEIGLIPGLADSLLAGKEEDKLKRRSTHRSHLSTLGYNCPCLLGEHSGMMSGLPSRMTSTLPVFASKTFGDQIEHQIEQLSAPLVPQKGALWSGALEPVRGPISMTARKITGARYGWKWIESQATKQKEALSMHSFSTI